MRPVRLIVEELVETCEQQYGVHSLDCSLERLVREYLNSAQESPWLGPESFWRLACSNDAPLGLVKFIVEKFPQACGNFPLHSACEFTTSPEVVEYLLNKFPVSAQVPLPNGQLPLHLACGRNKPLKIIELLVDAFPGAIYAANDLGNRPFDVSCYHLESFAEHNLLIPSGWTPLHFSLIHRPKSFIVQLLLLHYPANTRIGQEGLLPLHCACHRFMTIPVLRRILEAHPQALQMRNNKGELPLHYAIRRGAGPAVIHCLVQQYPGAVGEQTWSGQLPLHLACLYNAPLCVHFLLTRWHPESLLPAAHGATKDFEFSPNLD